MYDITVAIATIIMGIMLVGANPQQLEEADNWFILSYPDGTEVQGECEWWETIEVDGEDWVRVCVNGELYELPASQTDLID